MVTAPGFSLNPCLTLRTVGKSFIILGILEKLSISCRVHSTLFALMPLLAAFEAHSVAARFTNRRFLTLFALLYDLSAVFLGTPAQSRIKIDLHIELKLRVFLKDGLIAESFNVTFGEV
jgi:hypothetical protein